MSNQNARPKWWQLYLTFPLLLALFAMDHRLKISLRGHQIVQLGIILFVFGLVHLWLRANSSALQRRGEAPRYGTITVIHVPPAQSAADKSPLFQLPNPQVKGVLDDTFDMDYIDAEILPVDDVTQDLNKE